MKTFICSKCHVLLGVKEFHKDTSTRGHYTICKKCRASDPRKILNDLISNARKRAKKRGHPCTIDRNYILYLNEQQKGKCAYTGISLNWEIAFFNKQRICPPDRVSIDQTIPGKGYVVGNVKLVTDFVNRIKTWYPEKDFISFCRAVVDNSKSL